MRPIGLAIVGGHLSIVELLVEKGADIRVASQMNGEWADPGWKYPCSALHLSVEYERVDIAEFLLEHGADASEERTPGEPILRFVCERMGRVSTVQFVSMLLAKGARTSCQLGDINFETALSVAAGGGLEIGFPVVKMLVHAGADLYVESLNGSTCLQSAVQNSHTFDIAAYLIDECGMDVNAANSRGFTPLHTAVMFLPASAFRLVVDHGASVSACHPPLNLHPVNVIRVRAGQDPVPLLRLLAVEDMDLELVNGRETTTFQSLRESPYIPEEDRASAAALKAFALRPSRYQKFLMFCLGSHRRTGALSPVRLLVVDAMYMVWESLRRFEVMESNC